MSLRLVYVCAMVMGFAACDAPVSAPAEGMAATKPPVASNAGPGPKDVTTTEGARIFRAVCLDTHPSFKMAPAVLATMPFVQNGATKTYYHQELDLSIKLQGNQCSFVMAGKSLTPASIYRVLKDSNVGAKGRFVYSFEVDGRTYIRLVSGRV